MAYSLCAASVTLPPSQELHLRFQPQKPRPKLAATRIRPSPFTFCFKVKFERRLSLFGVFASNSNPSSGDSITEESGATRSGDTAQGPPFLTILAGFLVFFLICWMLGSIIMRLIGVILKLLPK
ncbi:uncharacterized protein LOC111309912 [Durio zibethinus]|uniref:Uncharacterized protein LOC111309912 n=1 Tax=Durio zibethinus TaxID=66656 RepID=A0A6P6AIF7_DURZI|nr:uncharacterized protein LOC111309912 [Durio zibethinus]